jgi:hypothetical protein
MKFFFEQQLFLSLRCRTAPSLGALSSEAATPGQCFFHFSTNASCAFSAASRVSRALASKLRSLCTLQRWCATPGHRRSSAAANRVAVADHQTRPSHLSRRHILQQQLPAVGRFRSRSHRCDGRKLPHLARAGAGRRKDRTQRRASRARGTPVERVPMRRVSFRCFHSCR